MKTGDFLITLFWLSHSTFFQLKTDDHKETKPEDLSIGLVAGLFFDRQRHFSLQNLIISYS
jgi:hypothetical protein